jgi:hypothetical protein
LAGRPGIIGRGYCKLFVADVEIFGPLGRARWRYQEFGGKLGANVGFAFSQFRLDFRFRYGMNPTRSGLLGQASYRSLLRESGRLDGIFSSAHYQAWAALRSRANVGISLFL